MADLSNNSFIPKRGPVKRIRNSASRQVYVFTIFSYVLMFSTLLATGGVYFYSKYVDKQKENEIALLNKEIDTFNETDMKKVIDFDNRLNQAYGRLDKSVSIVSVFEAIEDATIDTVQIDSLELKREKDDKFILSASVITDSFDSTMFQRSVYKRNQIIESVVISDVQAIGKSNESSEENKNVETNDDDTVMKFKAELEIPLSSVPYVVGTDEVESSSVDDFVIPPVNKGEENESDVPLINEENI